MELTNNKLFLEIINLVINDNMLVGLITKTNQFVPIVPEEYNELVHNKR